MMLVTSALSRFSVACRRTALAPATTTWLRSTTTATTTEATCGTIETKKLPEDGLGLHDFITKPKNRRQRLHVTPLDAHPYLSADDLRGHGRTVYVDVYGCQMNVSDAEVVWSILNAAGYERTHNPMEADVWLVVTCSIREGAENTVWKKLKHIQRKKKAKVYRPTLQVGLLGCMAERLKDELLAPEKPLVDVVAGPDSYRDLPRLFAVATASRQSSINVLLSLEETYADVLPMRLSAESVTGFVSIQRGCDNMCSYCIVPFTRGRERSRPVQSILNEVRALRDAGVKEVTLLGQNVNSYRDTSEESLALFSPAVAPTVNSSGFKTVYKPKVGGIRFSDLLDQVSLVDPEVRIRFVSAHPKDFPDEVLDLISERPNICKQLHLPAQSGSTAMLEAMRRGYTREAYLELVDHVRRRIPGVTLSSDFIGGFCGETEEQFEETISLMKMVKYHKAFVFPYSLREKTHAHRKLSDDVPESVKVRRHLRMTSVFREEADSLNRQFIGSEQLVLVEKDSKRSSEEYQGRTDGNVKAIFGKMLPDGSTLQPGDYCTVRVTGSSSEVVKGTPMERTTLAEFERLRGRQLKRADVL